jgi:hypothetical protein
MYPAILACFASPQHGAFANPRNPMAIVRPIQTQLRQAPLPKVSGAGTTGNRWNRLIPARCKLNDNKR